MSADPLAGWWYTNIEIVAKKTFPNAKNGKVRAIHQYRQEQWSISNKLHVYGFYGFKNFFVLSSTLHPWLSAQPQTIPHPSSKAGQERRRRKKVGAKVAPGALPVFPTKQHFWVGEPDSAEHWAMTRSIPHVETKKKLLHLQCSLHNSRNGLIAKLIFCAKIFLEWWDFFWAGFLGGMKQEKARDHALTT